MGVVENKETVKAFFGSIANAEPDVLGTLVTDDITWWIPQSAAARNADRIHSTPDERAVHGKSSVTTMLYQSGFYRDRRSSPEYEPQQYDRHHLIAEDDMVVSHHTLRTVTADGLDYENQYVFVFRFDGDKVAEVWEHLDTAYTYERLGLDA